MRWIVLAMAVALSSCNIGHTCGTKKNNIVKMLESKGFKFTANDKGDFLLGVKQIKSSVKIPFEQTIIKVYSVRDSRIVFEDELREAVVKWINSGTFKAEFLPRVKSLLPEDNITEYIYNVYTGKQQTLNSGEAEKI